MNARRAINGGRIFISKGRAWLVEVRFDHLDEIIHAQPEGDALAVDEKCRDGVNLRGISALDIFKDTILQLRRFHRLHEDAAIDSDAIREGSKCRLWVGLGGPFGLRLEQRVVHLPIVTLLTCGFHRLSCCHRIRVNADERKMMELEPELFWIPVQDFLHQWMESTAARTLVIPKLVQSEL